MITSPSTAKARCNARLCFGKIINAPATGRIAIQAGNTLGRKNRISITAPSAKLAFGIGPLVHPLMPLMHVAERRSTTALPGPAPA